MTEQNYNSYQRCYKKQQYYARSRQQSRNDYASANGKQLNAILGGRCTQGVSLTTLWFEYANNPFYSCTDYARLAITMQMVTRMNKRQNWITEIKMTTEYRCVARRDGTSTPPPDEVSYLGKRPFEQRMKIWRDGIRMLYQDRKALSTHNPQKNIYEM